MSHDPKILTRAATPGDEPFLWRMLTLAASMNGTDAEIETACDVVPQVIASMRQGSAAVAADPLGQGVGA